MKYIVALFLSLSVTCAWGGGLAGSVKPPPSIAGGSSGGAMKFIRVTSAWSPLNGSATATCPSNGVLVGGTCSRIDSGDESRGIRQGESGNGWRCWHNYEWDSRVQAIAFCAVP